MKQFAVNIKKLMMTTGLLLALLLVFPGMALADTADTKTDQDTTVTGSSIVTDSSEDQQDILDPETENDSASDEDQTEVTPAPDAETQILTGWQLGDDGNFYHYEEDGSLTPKGWYSEDGSWYWIKEDGSAARDEWLQVGNNWYYLKADCKMAAGEWAVIGGYYYYFKSWGGMYANTWLNQDGKYYYFRSWGGSFHDTFATVGGKLYYFDKNCARADAGWMSLDGTWYYVKDDGSVAHTEWLQQGSNWYYLKDDGAMAASEWVEVNGSSYYFKSWGGMYANTWLNMNDSYYYFRSWGGAYRNTFTSINGKLYYFDGNCKRADAGWLSVNGTWYYVKADGSCANGEWQQISGSWYYLKSGGAMAASEWVQVDGSWYYFKSWGGMYHDSWLDLNNNRYYFQSSGKMATGQMEIGGNTYYFKSWGGMARNATISGWKYDANGIGTKCEKPCIAIDAGHQAHGNSSTEPNGPGSSVMKAKVSSGTSGVATGLEESVLNLTVALKVRDILEERGYTVYMIRETQDVDISNKERAQNAAAAGADILVRIHANGEDDQSYYGALTISPTSSNPYLSSELISKSKLLSRKMIDSFCAATGARNIGIWETDTMSGINWATIPVTIIEMGYMSNPSEDRLMATDAYQNKMAQGIADGIDAYYAAQ